MALLEFRASAAPFEVQASERRPLSVARSWPWLQGPPSGVRSSSFNGARLRAASRTAPRSPAVGITAIACFFGYLKSAILSAARILVCKVHPIGPPAEPLDQTRRKGQGCVKAGLHSPYDRGTLGTPPLKVTATSSAALSRGVRAHCFAPLFGGLAYRATMSANAARRSAASRTRPLGARSAARPCQSPTNLFPRHHGRRIVVFTAGA